MDRKDILRTLACFGCEDKEACESAWEEGHEHCDDKMNEALDLIEEIGIKLD